MRSLALWLAIWDMRIRFITALIEVMGSWLMYLLPSEFPDVVGYLLSGLFSIVGKCVLTQAIKGQDGKDGLC